MFNFLSRIFRGSKEQKSNGHDHTPDAVAEIPPEVEEIRRQKAQARTKSDRAETQLEKARFDHRETVFSANRSFSGLTATEAEQEALDKMKAKWLEENKGTAPA